MPKYWRPLTQEEIAGLVEGDALLIRQNYLWNPERRPITYVEATYVAKVKRAVIQILEKGSDTATCVGLTEVGRLLFLYDGWHMTPEEWEKIKSGDPVIIHQDSGECRPARFVTGAHFFTAKVIFEGETELSSVAARKIGAVRSSDLPSDVPATFSEVVQIGRARDTNAVPIAD